MASDETMIRLHRARKFSWQRPGERRIVRTVKFSLKVNVWGCFSEQGFGRVCWFIHDVNSKFLCNHIYRNALLPSARHHFARAPWFLLEDNDPKNRPNYNLGLEKLSSHRHITMAVDKSRYECNQEPLVNSENEGRLSKTSHDKGFGKSNQYRMEQLAERTRIKTY